MMGLLPRDEADRLAAASAEAQGLPAVIDDPDVLDRVATITRPVLDQLAGDEAGAA